MMRDMAATLKQLGFTVASAINADQRTMKRLIREFGQQLKSGGQGLFYYAGHGVQLRRAEGDRRAATQRQADEIARKTVTFKGSITVSPGNYFSNLTLTVSAGKVSFVCGEGKWCGAGATGNFECSQFASAVIDGSAIRESKASTVSTDKYRFKFRFNAASPAEAALEAIRQVCGGK
jgi:hypothetical protein